MNANLINAIINADEMFLITLANKGIYNRAVKEYESSVTNMEIDSDNGAVTAVFSDGVNISVTETVQNYKCSCPSRTVCKHLIMAILAAQNKLKENMPQNAAETEETPVRPEPDFDFIAEIIPKQLEKLTSKKIYSTALFNVKTGAKALIELSSVLSVTLKDMQSGKDITVKFLPLNQSDLSKLPDNASCGCKSPDFCVHKTEAVLHFIIYKKSSLPDGFFPETTEDKSRENTQNIEINEYIIPYIKQFANDIFSVGLARNSDIVSQRFLQLATICHSQGLADLERICNRISAQYELFEKKSALFSADYLTDDLCRLILSCSEIEKRGANKASAGVFREQYNQIPPAEFYGLGAYQWHSTGGYTGVTAVFYSPELSDFATFANVKPDDTNPTANQLYNLPAPWGISTKLSAITDICVLLKNAKINSKNNISSSNETTAQVMEKTNIFSDKLTPVRYDNFAVLAEKLWENRRDGDESAVQSRSVMGLALPRKYDKAVFDSVNQIYSFAVYDKDNRKITVSVKYEPATGLLIENLKKLESRNLMYGPILLRVYVENGKLNAYPIGLYIKDDEEDIMSDKFNLINLSLDDLDAKRNRDKNKDSKKGASKFFNWF